jgi:hypothetical protein
MVTKRRSCRCGWALPDDSGVFRNGEDPSIENVVPGYYIAISCPECSQLHTFISVSDPEVFMEMQRQNRKKNGDA